MLVFCESSCGSSVAATWTLFSVFCVRHFVCDKKFRVVLCPLAPDPGDAFGSTSCREYRQHRYGPKKLRHAYPMYCVWKCTVLLGHAVAYRWRCDCRVDSASGLCCQLTTPCPRSRPQMYDLSRETRDNWEIPRSEIKLIEQLGAGNFGEVWKGRL